MLWNCSKSRGRGRSVYWLSVFFKAVLKVFIVLSRPLYVLLVKTSVVYHVDAMSRYDHSPVPELSLPGARPVVEHRG